MQDNNSSRIHGQADDCDTDSENMANDQREIEKEDFDESSFDLESLDVRKTIGTGRSMDDYSMTYLKESSGTFARVCLCHHAPSSSYFALKILSLHEVVRLNQVEHTKNEKNILQVC